MARKSRKQNNIVETQTIKSSFVQAAAYVRLSLEDRAKKGNSIENQQSLISNYIDEHSNFELYDTYIDLGVSGTTFERPNFQRMLRDAEAGKIKCIIMKDLSRLGRNAIDTGYYVEKLFPLLGVRLIAITDNFDSKNYDGSITMPITNLLNEIYALDIGRKTKSQKRQAMRDGVYVGGRPPYGYMRSPDDNQAIDTSAAENVRQIFIWAADNISVFEIARRLNASRVPSPTAYRSGVSTSGETNAATPGLWHPRTIKRILVNEIYLGRLVQGKTQKVDFTRQPTPSHEWICVDAAHEAIISDEIFQVVQALIRQEQNTTTQDSRIAYSTNIFKGKIYCAYCGGSLERRKKYNKYTYYCVANRIVPNSCVGNRIDEDDVRIVVIGQLLQYRGLISDDSNTVPTDSADISHELHYVNMELSYTQDVTRSLYENLVNGVLDRTEYRELKGGYQKKLDALTQCADELKRKLDDEKRQRINLQKSLQMLNELADTRVLEQAHVENLIESIQVFQDGRIYVGMRKING